MKTMNQFLISEIDYFEGILYELLPTPCEPEVSNRTEQLVFNMREITSDAVIIVHKLDQHVLVGSVFTEQSTFVFYCSLSRRLFDS